MAENLSFDIDLTAPLDDNLFKDILNNQTQQQLQQPQQQPQTSLLTQQTQHIHLQQQQQQQQHLNRQIFLNRQQQQQQQQLQIQQIKQQLQSTGVTTTNIVATSVSSTGVRIQQQQPAHANNYQTQSHFTVNNNNGVQPTPATTPTPIAAAVTRTQTPTATAVSANTNIISNLGQLSSNPNSSNQQAILIKNNNGQYQLLTTTTVSANKQNVIQSQQQHHLQQQQSQQQQQQLLLRQQQMQQQQQQQQHIQPSTVVRFPTQSQQQTQQQPNQNNLVLITNNNNTNKSLQQQQQQSSSSNHLNPQQGFIYASTTSATSTVVNNNSSGNKPILPQPQQQQQQTGSTGFGAINQQQSATPMNLLKCLKKFLHTLLELANNSLPDKYPLVKNLIQDLLDNKIDAETFIKRIQIEKNPPSPSLVPFLQKAMSHLRSLYGNKPITIEQFLEIGGNQLPQVQQTTQVNLLSSSSTPSINNVASNQTATPIITQSPSVVIINRTAAQQQTIPVQPQQPQLRPLIPQPQVQQQQNQLQHQHQIPSQLQQSTSSGTMPNIVNIPNGTTLTQQQYQQLKQQQQQQLKYQQQQQQSIQSKPIVTASSQQQPQIQLISSAQFQSQQQFQQPFQQQQQTLSKLAQSPITAAVYQAQSPQQSTSSPSSVKILNSQLNPHNSPSPQQPYQTGLSPINQLNPSPVKNEPHYHQPASASPKSLKQTSKQSDEISPSSKQTIAKMKSSVHSSDLNDFDEQSNLMGVDLEAEKKLLSANPVTMVNIVSRPMTSIDQMKSCKDVKFLNINILQQKFAECAKKHKLDDVAVDVATLVSQATQHYLRNIIEQLNIVSQHRLDMSMRTNDSYEMTNDVKSQIKFIDELDKLEKKKKDEAEREKLMKAAKSRSKAEDIELNKLKQKAKEVIQAESDELRRQDANKTALAAIGPRKKRKIDDPTSSTSLTNTRTVFRPKIKRVSLKDLIFLMEQEKDFKRSALLYRALNK